MTFLFLETGIPKIIAEDLSKYGKKITYKPREVIVLQEQYLDKLFYIEKGFVKFTLFSLEGGEQTVFYLGKGFFCGEYPFLAGGLKSDVTIEAATETQLLVFTQCTKDCLCHIEGFKKLLLSNMSLIAKTIKTQIVNITLHSAEERICKTMEEAERYFKNEEGNKISLTRKEIADLSGCSVETVNRYMKTIKDREMK